MAAMTAAASVCATQGYLSQEEIQTFWKQGYVIKKGCVDPDTIALLDQKTTSVLTRILEEVKQDKYPYDLKQQITYIDDTQVVFKKLSSEKVSILRIVGCGGIDPFFVSVLRSDKMAMTFFKLLGCDQLEHIICQFHPKQPGDGVGFPKHRDIHYRKAFDKDWKDVLGNGSYAIAILAVDPASKANGCLIADTGSYPIDTGVEVPVVLEMEPGDLLFMHPEILHWSEENTSGNSRRALLSGFCAWGANHKNYPGTNVNIHLTCTGGTISADPANWDKKDIETTGGGH